MKLKLPALMILMALTAMPLFAQQERGQGRPEGQSRENMQRQDQRQRTPRTEASVKERVAKLAEILECTDEQKKKMTEFEIAQYKKTQKEREKFSGDREAMRSYMQAQRKLSNEKYAEILTPEQMKKYNKLLEKRRPQQPGRSSDQNSSDQRSRGRGGN